LKCRDGSYHERLEEQRECGFPTRETAVEEADAGDDEPDDKSAENEVRVVVFETDVLGVYVD
jgi:hypothetical protein